MKNPLLKVSWIFLVGLMLFTISVPAMAADSEVDITTQTTVTSSGNAPSVIAKWEMLSAEPWDDDLLEPGFQIEPSCRYQVNADYNLYALVWDEEGVESINEVYADVFHPDWNVDPADDQNNDLNGQFKYQVRLGSDGDLDTTVTPVARAEALERWDTALELNLISFDFREVLPEEIANLTTSTAYADDLREAILQDLAWVVRGTAALSYHQPAGWYRVQVNAVDSGNAWSTALENEFYYIPVACAEFDNTSLFYGQTDVGTHRWKAGDYDFTPGDGNMTVRNLGNTWAQILVKQNDMLFGQTLVGDSLEWNVKYDARLTENGTILDYFPSLAGDQTEADFFALAAQTFNEIPGILKLCNTLKLDFSIEVLKAPPDVYQGAMILGYQYIPFPSIPQ